MARLTPKQATFAREYLRDLSATKAAERAGYSPATAKQQGSRLLTNVDVAAEIERLMAERSARVEVSADDVVRELLRIARGDMRELAEWGPAGVRLKPSGELPDDAAMMVESVAEGPHGVRIKTKPAVRALELLGRHCGMFHDRVTVDTPDRYANMSDAEIEAELYRFVRAQGYIRPEDEGPPDPGAADPGPGPSGPAPPPPLAPSAPDPPADPEPSDPAGDLATGPEPAGDDDPPAAADDSGVARMRRELAELRRQIDEWQAGEGDPDSERPAPRYETDPDNPPGVVDQWRAPRLPGQRRCS